jgi:hypothetical protein
VGEQIGSSRSLPTALNRRQRDWAARIVSARPAVPRVCPGQRVAGRSLTRKRSTALNRVERPRIACTCRKTRPYRSGGVSVLVEDAAESIASSDVEAVELFRCGDRLGEWAQGCCGVEGQVGWVQTRHLSDRRSDDRPGLRTPAAATPTVRRPGQHRCWDLPGGEHPGPLIQRSHLRTPFDVRCPSIISVRRLPSSMTAGATGRQPERCRRSPNRGPTGSGHDMLPTANSSAGRTLGEHRRTQLIR